MSAKKQTVVWLNGSFVETAEAKVSAFDAAFQHAVGVFETMLAVGHTEGERVIGIEAHLDRLALSASELGLTNDLRVGPLIDAVRLAVERAELAPGERARIRLTLTGGDLNLLTSSNTDERTPTVLIHATPAQQYPAEMFEKGVAVTIAEAKANPLNRFESHKTLNYWWRLSSLQQAAAAGCGECLVLAVTNHLCGGAVSNLFIVKDGSLITPIARTEESQGAIPSPVLPGITRAQVIELAEMLGVGTDKRLVTIDDVLDADELFLTNSSWGVLPVVNVEKKAIGDGAVGQLTKSLRERWEQVVVLDE